MGKSYLTGALSVTVTEIVNVRLNMNVALTVNCQMHDLQEVFRKFKSHGNFSWNQEQVIKCLRVCVFLYCSVTLEQTLVNISHFNAE